MTASSVQTWFYMYAYVKKSSPGSTQLPTSRHLLSPPTCATMTHTHTACCHGYCTSQCSDLAQLAPTSKGLSISPYVQRLTLHWITLSTLLMMAHKAETAVQGWSVDPMEVVILTHIHTPIKRLWSPLAYGLGGNKCFYFQHFLGLRLVRGEASRKGKVK